ncbi:MAG: hypothetical protein IJV76_11695 [Clostridia bacterium]|nr:hypothetical protein [Clostridia bacterium]
MLDSKSKKELETLIGIIAKNNKLSILYSQYCLKNYDKKYCFSDEENERNSNFIRIFQQTKRSETEQIQFVQEYFGSLNNLFAEVNLRIYHNSNPDTVYPFKKMVSEQQSEEVPVEFQKYQFEDGVITRFTLTENRAVLVFKDILCYEGRVRGCNLQVTLFLQSAIEISFHSNIERWIRYSSITQTEYYNEILLQTDSGYIKAKFTNFEIEEIE